MDPLLTVSLLFNIAFGSTILYFFFGPEVEADE